MVGLMIVHLSQVAPTVPMAPTVLVQKTQKPASCTGSTLYQKGVASWYGKWHHGRTMKNGEPFDMYADTVAHPTLPMGTMLCVRNPRNHKEVIVEVTDLGPFHGPRIVDLSKKVASKLGISGLGAVEIYLM